MNCTNCGTSLPQGAGFCPTCGTLTSAYYSSAGAAPDAATVMSSPDSTPVPLPPPDYGRPPYGVVPPSPYSILPATPYDPYNTPPLTPPPPSPPRRGNRIGLLILAVLLAVIVGGGGVLVLLRPGARTSSPPSPTRTPAPPTRTPAQATATAVAQVNAMATATVIARQNIYIDATQGTPSLNDPLSTQDSNKWDEDRGCGFSGGVYHVIVSIAGEFYNCNARSTNFGNLALQVQMVITQGDGGGVFFRSDSQGNNAYYFIVDVNGSYRLEVWKNNNLLAGLVGGISPAFKTGLNQSNTITVVAKGSNFSLFINRQYVASASDTNFTSGQIGLVADEDTHSTGVAYSNLQVWKQ